MKEFERYRLNILRERISFSFMKTAIPFYLGASIIDWVYVPHLWSEFLWIRIFSCLCFAILGWAVSTKQIFKTKIIRHGSYLVTGILGAGLGYMTYRTGGLESPYYAGLNWVGIGTLAFWPGRHSDRAIWMLTTYGPVFLFVIISQQPMFTPLALLASIFMIGTILLSVISNVLTMRSLRVELQLRGQLQNLIQDKDKIIEIKSSESANLKRLAKQFSPAVIQAIESRTISLTERARKKVAIIFVDVVGSTSRSNSIDHGDYQKAMDLFFDLTIKLLLARNVTVANFMGDGLMAIVNAPFPVENFEQHALETCLELLQATKKRQRSLREFWHEDFHIRIGVSSGYSNVGFFPNTDFGVYTAIGDSVNLASRLCSNAESSSVATTKAIVVAAQEKLNDYHVKHGASISTFKGFAGHQIEYFIVAPKVDGNAIAESETCPLCTSPVRVASDLGDCVVIRCTSCQYSDVQSKSDRSAA